MRIGRQEINLGGYLGLQRPPKRDLGSSKMVRSTSRTLQLVQICGVGGLPEVDFSLLNSKTRGLEDWRTCYPVSVTPVASRPSELSYSLYAQTSTESD